MNSHFNPPTASLSVNYEGMDDNRGEGGRKVEDGIIYTQ